MSKVAFFQNELYTVYDVLHNVIVYKTKSKEKAERIIELKGRGFEKIVPDFFTYVIN